MTAWLRTQGERVNPKRVARLMRTMGLEAIYPISQDGRGRVFDNIFVERLWRSVKYKEVYPKAYTGVNDAISNLDNYFHFYNYQRLHQSLDYLPPAMVHFS